MCIETNGTSITVEVEEIESMLTFLLANPKAGELLPLLATLFAQGVAA